jgi:hypothetical protein
MMFLNDEELKLEIFRTSPGTPISILENVYQWIKADTSPPKTNNEKEKS